MDKRELIEVLQALDEELTSSFDVILVGGAAMILHFGASRATRDVDVLVLRGDPTELREAVRAIARQRDLPEDWMSDAAKGFADILPPEFYHRVDFDRIGHRRYSTFYRSRDGRSTRPAVSRMAPTGRSGVTGRSGHQLAGPLS